MKSETVLSASGRSLNDLSMEALLAGELSPRDFRTSDETLRRQADAAEAAGYSQLAENLRRAAELTGISNQEVLNIYKALRPGRSTYNELITLADHLENDLDAPLTAAFVREAAEVYQERDILRNP